MIAIEMKMPRRCVDCRFRHIHYGDNKFFCYARYMYIRAEEENRRQPWCPLIEVAAVAPVFPEQTLKQKFR